MKNQVSRILSFGIALAAVVSVHAQSGVRAAVPFEFYVGSSAMPAGAYMVDEYSSGAVARISLMKGSAAKTITTMHLIGKKMDEPARLVFHRYGEEYFLAQIWTGEGSIGQALPSSQREKELAQSGSSTLAMISVALHR